MQNLFIGKGNLAKSPTLEHKTSRDGKDFIVANMRVMFGRYARGEDGQMTQVDGFWRGVEIYGSKAEACAKYLRKGARVLVIGEERSYHAKDENGNEVQVIKILADDVALQLTRVESITFVTKPKGEVVEEE